VKHSSIRTFFGMVDMKNNFLHGELEEEIYMDQLVGFIVPSKKDLICKLKSFIYGFRSLLDSDIKGLIYLCLNMISRYFSMIVVFTLSLLMDPLYTCCYM
jgi:hypothetical protein